MIHKERIYILVWMLFITSNIAIAQPTPKEQEALRKKRLNKVEFYHMGVGLETGISHNFVFGPVIYGGIGSFRNLINADIGLKLLWTNPAGSSSKERISHLHLPIFAHLSLNLLRWQNGSAYIGGEFDYHLYLNATHHLPTGGSISDKDLSHSYASVGPRLGVRFNRWNIQVFYEWDLSPAFEQKYVYESSDYNYDALHDALFNRSRFGLSVSYVFPF